MKQLVYDAADRLLSAGVPRVINGERMRLSPRVARLYHRDHEPEKADFLRAHCRPGTTVMDIGANFGVFTVIMARAVGPQGRVLAFEPTESTCAVLRRTVAQNRCTDTVRVHQAAMSSHSGTGTLHLSEHPGDMGNSLVAHHASTAREIPVALLSVDEAGDGADVSCIKIDAEGAELDILRGSESTIARCGPALTIEVHPWLLDEDARRALWDLLTGWGLSIRRTGASAGGSTLSPDAYLAEEQPFEIQALRPDRGRA